MDGNLDRFACGIDKFIPDKLLGKVEMPVLEKSFVVYLYGFMSVTPMTEGYYIFLFHQFIKRLDALADEELRYRRNFSSGLFHLSGPIKAISSSSMSTLAESPSVE